MAAFMDEEFLKCPVCLSTVKSPRILPCGHSICEACLEPLTNAENGKFKVKCPECRSGCDRPADGFPKNFKLAGRFVGRVCIFWRCHEITCLEILDNLEITDERSVKDCHACEDSVHVSKAFRCLACEKDFALRVRKKNYKAACRKY